MNINTILWKSTNDKHWLIKRWYNLILFWLAPDAILRNMLGNVFYVRQASEGDNLKGESLKDNILYYFVVEK